MEELAFSSVFPIITAVSFLFAGGVSLFAYSRNNLNYLFAGICICIGLWQASWSVLFNTPDLPLAQYIAVIGQIPIILLPPLLLQIAHTITDKKSRYVGYIVWTGWIVAIILQVLLLTTNWIIDGVTAYSWGYYPYAGSLHWIAVVHMIFFVLAAIGNLLYYRKKASTTMSAQRAWYIIVAIAIFSYSFVDVLPLYGYNIYPIGFIFLFGFLIYAWFAITDCNLLQLQRSTIFISTSFALFLYTATSYYLLHVLEDNMNLTRYTMLLELLSIAFFALAGYLIIKWFNKKLEETRVGNVNYIRIIEMMLEELDQVKSNKEISEVLGENISLIFNGYVLVVLQSTDGSPQLYFSPALNYRKINALVNHDYKELFDLLGNKESLVTIDDLAFTAIPGGTKSKLYEFLAQENIQAIMPLNYSNKRGYIAVSKPSSSISLKEKDVLRMLRPTIESILERRATD